MSRLIDADYLEAVLCNVKKDLDREGDSFKSYAVEAAARIIHESATVDPIHAAGGCYCRECIMGTKAENGKVHCQLKLIVNGPDDFCSSGKIRLEVLRGG